MVIDIYLVPVFSKSGQIGQMIGIFHKAYRKKILGDFTQNGGASALSALIMIGDWHEWPAR